MQGLSGLLKDSYENGTHQQQAKSIHPIKMSVVIRSYTQNNIIFP